MPGMDTTLAAVIVAGVTLAFNVSLHFFGGGWKLSGRLTSIESSMDSVKAEIKKLGDVLVRIADMRGELRVLDTRMAAAEQDIRELRHGDGFVRGARGVDREYP
jgi:hypothetical protein